LAVRVCRFVNGIKIGAVSSFPSLPAEAYLFTTSNLKHAYDPYNYA
jgi:hypothetical protein